MNINLMEYYGVDWMIFLFTILQMWLLGEKKRSSWVAGGLLAIASGIFGWMIDSFAIVFMNLIFLFFDAWNYVKWSSPKDA
ncbi:hypothetical protein H8D29_03785 [PVC group bacterium]|nr:hypothetical protein [PVC group bacterium]